MKRKIFNLTLFIFLIESISAISNSDLLFKLLDINKRYSHLNRSEKSLESSHFDWNTNNVCISGSNCFLKQPFHGQKKINLLIFGEISLLQSIECPCLGSLSYPCGGDYCTTDENTCLSLIHLKTNRKFNDKANTLFKSCNNSNITIKANLFNYRLRF